MYGNDSGDDSPDTRFALSKTPIVTTWTLTTRTTKKSKDSLSPSNQFRTAVTRPINTPSGGWIAPRAGADPDGRTALETDRSAGNISTYR